MKIEIPSEKVAENLRIIIEALREQTDWELAKQATTPSDRHVWTRIKQHMSETIEALHIAELQ